MYISCMLSFGEKVIQFNEEVSLSDPLPEGIRAMNPFRDSMEILRISRLFYKKYYNDTFFRRMIIGINPGRLGAGATGIPFTDTKRLADVCGIKVDSFNTHEPSSVFVYEMIAAYGGPEVFYRDYYINSVSPLGFVRKNKKGNWINCNYYDEKVLFESLIPFIVDNLKKQLDFGIDRQIAFVLGKKNFKFLDIINRKEKLFEKLFVFDHPRFIVQYRWNRREDYIQEYLKKLK